MLPLVLRLVVALAMVAGLLWMAARIARRRGLGSTPGVVQVLARQPLSRSSAVCVVKVADRVLIVGSSDQRVTLLGETDLAAVEESTRHTRPAAVRAAAPVAERPAAPEPAPAMGSGVVAGSVLDRHQWSALVGGLRERTVRR